jgi:hypothetical protein
VEFAALFSQDAPGKPAMNESIAAKLRDASKQKHPAEISQDASCLSLADTAAVVLPPARFAMNCQAIRIQKS